MALSAQRRARRPPAAQELVYVKRDWSGGPGAYRQHPNRYNTLLGGDARFPGRVFSGPLHTATEVGPTRSPFPTPVLAMAEFNGQWYVHDGRRVYRLTNWNVTAPQLSYFTEVLDAGPGATSTDVDLVVFGVGSTNYLIASFGDSAPYRYTTDGTTWTASNRGHPADKAGFMTVLNNVLHKTRSPNLHYQTTNPLNGGTPWSSADEIGHAGSSIRNMLSVDGAVLFVKDDNVYSFSEFGDVQELLPDYARGSISAGLGAAAWDRQLWLPSWSGIIYGIGRAGVQRLAPPSRLVDPDFRLGIRPTHAWPWGDELFVMAYTAQATPQARTVYSLRRGQFGGYVWHQLIDFPPVDVYKMGVSSPVATTNPVLWFSVTAPGGNFMYLTVLPLLEDPTQDDNYRFDVIWHLVEPWIDFDLPGTLKDYEYLELFTEGDPAVTIYVFLYDENGRVFLNEAVNAGFKGRIFPSRAFRGYRARPRFQVHAGLSTRFATILEYRLYATALQVPRTIDRNRRVEEFR